MMLKAKTTMMKIIAIVALAIMLLPAASYAYDPSKNPESYGNGMVLGVVTPSGVVFYWKDSLLSGFDFFDTHGFHQYFPMVFSQKGSDSPRIPAADLAHAPSPINGNPAYGAIVDMAYAKEGKATFHNVTTSSQGSSFSVTLRYAFAGGLFPLLQHRYEGLSVNDVVVAPKIDFPRTSQTMSDFSVFWTKTIHNVQLNPGVANKIEVFNVDGMGLARLDTMRIHPEGTP
jgi:hypothetical protein